MNAVVSGQAGVALLLDGDTLSSLRAGHPGEVIRRSPGEVPLLFGDARDLQFLERVELEEVSSRLERASEEVDALHLALILLDESLVPDTRRTAAEELEELLEIEGNHRFVENILYAHPLPRGADLDGALAVCPGDVNLNRNLLERLRSLQAVITEVYFAWEQVPEGLFDGKRDRAYVQAIAVREGFFRDLVGLRATAGSFKGFEEKVLHKSSFRALPNYEEILREWMVPLRGDSVPNDRGKWALLIGINRYPMFAPRGQLRGSVNDVQLMRQVLVESFDFPEEHITLLADEQATREGILAAMKELIEQVRKDDVVVFHYSGHGSQMIDLERDEPDGLVNTIVPYDSGRAPHANRDIIGEEIYLWLRELTTKTSFVTLIFDCSHSGTIVRDAFGGEMRWVEPDLRPPEELPLSPLSFEGRSLLASSRDLGPSDWLPLNQRYVLIAGSRSDERSYEIEEPPGVRHGALTYFLSQELFKVQPGTTYRDIFEIAASRVSSRFPNQHPQLEGARNLEVFGVRRFEPQAFVSVQERDGDRVVLGAGGAYGLRAGSQWAIYRRGAKAVKPEEEPLGLVSITSVRTVSSEGRILWESRPGTVMPGMRAIEEIRALETLLPVQVVTPYRHGSDVQALLEGLDQSKLLRRAEPDEYAKARVYLLPPRASVTSRAAVPMLGLLAEETWAVVGENGDLLMPARRRSEPGVVQTLLENLEKVACYRLVLDLRNEKSALSGKLDVELFRWTGEKLEKPELGPDLREVFCEGDNLALRIVNRSQQSLFVYVLDLGLIGRIQLAYPVAGAEESLEPGRAIEVGTRPGEEMSLYLPEEFPFSSGDPRAEGVETLKVFATSHPTDFLPLFQTSFREGRKGPHGPVSSLGDVLSATFGGGGYRDFKRQSLGSVPEDWTTVERSFRLRRRQATRTETQSA